MREADIIIGHAGAGTILQSLRMKKKLIVVMNSSLMDNHQNELAEVMHSHKYALCSHTSALLSNIVSINTYDIQPFPDSNPEIFAAIVNQQMNIDNKH
ncbi:hypothetical protein BDB01DRAFT_793112 [Pilobolus umbonatus]|nr:hypothetical protein BDB01DRAFT_793112 [Pilobolus umbonatus]